MCTGNFGAEAWGGIASTILWGPSGFHEGLVIIDEAQTKIAKLAGERGFGKLLLVIATPRILPLKTSGYACTWGLPIPNLK
eukprot:4865004-Amphidinium_carterae.1